MVQMEDGASIGPRKRDDTIEYLLDMLAGLARLAREADEIGIAIHLEAIIAARSATGKDRPAR